MARAKGHWEAYWPELYTVVSLLVAAPARPCAPRRQHFAPIRPHEHAHALAFGRATFHAACCTHAYARTRCCCTEGKLQVAFQAEAERYTRTPGAGLHYIAFDFHHECSKGRYDRIELLMQKVRAAGGGGKGQTAGEGGSQDGG